MISSILEQVVRQCSVTCSDLPNDVNVHFVCDQLFMEFTTSAKCNRYNSDKVYIIIGAQQRLSKFITIHELITRCSQKPCLSQSMLTQSLDEPCLMWQWDEMFTIFPKGASPYFCMLQSEVKQNCTMDVLVAVNPENSILLWLSVKVLFVHRPSNNSKSAKVEIKHSSNIL